MQNARQYLCFHVPGTLAANIDIRWTVPHDCRLVHVSAVSSNDSDATLAIGTSADTDEILAAATIGDSQVPVEKTVSNWATTNPTGALVKGDVFVVTLDYDGAAGTAADDFTLVLTFLEG
jgi:hypothetical protein